ncbi:MAG: hypothetical protein HQ591_01240 [candidate division Zixibacteria bacterium]|nr:hypothetical protein [Candidatus Tariuqbacter arcticus]
MNAEKLKTFIKNKIPTFDNVGVIGPGTAFHYTMHAEAILADGRFYGAPIDENLDKTQTSLVSKQAKADPGVVFAYELIEDAKEEGFGCKIFKIKYNKAVYAIHRTSCKSRLIS